MLLAAFALTYGGMAVLSLAMSRHAREALGREVTKLQGLALRLIGSCALILALVLAARDAGWPIATVTWTGMLSMSAMVVAVLHTYRAPLMVDISFWLILCAGILALPA